MKVWSALFLVQLISLVIVSEFSICVYVGGFIVICIEGNMCKFMRVSVVYIVS